MQSRGEIEAEKRVRNWITNGDVNEPLNLSRLELTSLPSLPDTLTKLWCSYNNLTSLPDLPDTLTILGCPNNKLTSLRKLPDKTISICCKNYFLWEYNYRYILNIQKLKTQQYTILFNRDVCSLIKLY